MPEALIAEGRFGIFPGEVIEDARAAPAVCLAKVTANDPCLKEHPQALTWIEGQFKLGQTSLAEPILGTLGNAHTQVLGAQPQVQGGTVRVRSLPVY